MNPLIKKLLVNELKIVLNKLETDTCNISTEEAIALVDTISHVPMNKEEACQYLKISRDTFDRHVALGHIPKGIKHKTIKVHIWYKDELRNFKDRLKH